jgi:hypothetical protein
MSIENALSVTVPGGTTVPLYYFNVINAAGAVLDVEGTDLPDLEAARVEA